ncbi:Blue-light-activated protein [Methylorubrum aminovorans]|nr:Blue-light-activated protein [Methylorubrum aminovorans]
MTDIPEKRPHGVHTSVEAGAAGHEFEAGNDIFFAAVSMTRMPMVVVDPNRDDHPIVFVNQAFLEMTGYARDEVIGRNCRFLQGPETDPETRAQVRDAVAARRDVATEILNYRKDGSSFWNALFVSPVYNAAGDLVYFFGSQLDITRRRLAEDSLHQAQKMEAIGQLTGGIAHDFNNLLQVILGYADSLATNLERPDADPGRMGRAVGNIREAAERASTLTQQLLAFARKQRLVGRTLNLNDLVTETKELAARTLGDAVTIETDLAPDLRACRIDRTQAEVALLNVLINARDAMPEGARHHHDPQRGSQPPRRHRRPRQRRGDGYRLRHPLGRAGAGDGPVLHDEGGGQGHRTRPVDGLRLCQAVGGFAQIESVMGEGTTVRLSFPATEEEGELSEPPPSVEERPGTETILIVDDRADVAELARAILRDYGYGTLMARHGREALEILGDHPEIDLLFSDLIMPGGMDGLSLAREARRRNPALKILLTTGYAEASLERTGIERPEFDILNKPYRRAELIRRVRAALDAPVRN